MGSPTEETGAYAHLAFNSALAGMIPELFAPWQHRVTLVGWVVEDDGRCEPSYLVDAMALDVAEAVAAELDPHATADATPLVSLLDDYTAVTAYAVTDPALGGRGATPRRPFGHHRGPYRPRERNV